MADIIFSSRAPDMVSYHVTQSSFGPLLVGYTSGKQLCRLSFLDKHRPASIIKEWKNEWPTTTFAEAPKPRPFSANTDIFLVGTDFQHRVWAALLDIPEGQTMTYGELAARIGKPKAARAVGTALGANPVPLLVPCHRVVSTTGLGGFTGGLHIKKKLLNTEAA